MMRTCPLCKGKGECLDVDQWPNPKRATLEPCIVCDGTGTVAAEQTEEETAGPQHYPFSPECTHFSSTNPNHPETVSRVLGLFDGLTVPQHGVLATDEAPSEGTSTMDAGRDGYDEGLTQGYDDGVEAMRAACIIAIQGVLERMGFGTTHLASDLRIALEGATP